MDPPGPNQSSEIIQADADPMDPLYSSISNQVPEMFQADAPSPLQDNIELDVTSPDVLSSKHQSSGIGIVERTSRVLEQRWGNSCLECSGNGWGDDSDEDEAEDGVVEPAIPEIGDDEKSGEESVDSDDNEDTVS